MSWPINDDLVVMAACQLTKESVQRAWAGLEPGEGKLVGQSAINSAASGNARTVSISPS
jgi:hypothetical protein